MIEDLLDVPSYQRTRLVSALESGLLVPPYSDASLQSVLGVHVPREDAAPALQELAQLGIAGRLDPDS